MDMVYGLKRLKLLTPKRCLDYQYYLNNQLASLQSSTKKERRDAANTKW
jgi:hypothetical protein